MRRALVCFAFLTIALLAAAGQAAAQAPLPDCTSADQLVFPSSDQEFQPVAPARALYTLNLDVDHPEQVTNVTIAYAGASTTDQAVSTPTPTAAEMKIGLGLPAAPQLGTLTLSWDQNAGQPLACHASVKEPFWVLDPGADVGDWAAPSLTGKFTLTERPHNFHGRTVKEREAFTPRCDVFACDVKINDGAQAGELVYHRGADDSVGVWSGASAWAPSPGFSCGRYKGVVSERTAVTLMSSGFRAVKQGLSAFPVVTRLTGTLKVQYNLNARGRAHCHDTPSPAVWSVTGVPRR
jgi:hypothetical protein